MMEKSANGEVIDKRITKEQLLKQFTYDPVNEDKSIFATLWDSVTSLFGETKVNGQITDAVVLDGNLQICPGATADGLVVHSEGTANLMKDSIIEGEITTTGGEINVEAGADVSGAQFNFDLSSMSNGNDTILLNDIGNILEAQIAVTVNNDQALGRYLLAGGAGALSKSVSLNGVRQFDKETDAGFVEGLLGVLTAGEEIRLDGKTFRLSEVDGQLVMDIWRQVCGLTEAAGLISWSESKNASQYIVEISGDGFEHAIAFALDALSLQAVSVPNANFQWRITAGEEYAWTKPADFTIGFHSSPTVLSAASDGVMDVYFAKVTGTWSAGFFARHLGDGDWSGTGQDISLAGKNVVSDLFFGSDDTSILVLTDDAQGDALFLDDIFSLFPEGSEAQARLAGIDELLAGAGNDVIDLTSQDFGYLGAGMTVRGGLGDDVIWANKGNNFLFGDAGNDRLIGASGNEVIVGGSDDDVLHGGGGEDIFVFGGDWGQDSVEQLGNGKITLWFAGNDEGHWNAEERRYSDGVNTVEVVGECANIFVKYGDDGSDQYQNLLAMGAFETFSSERIFEDTNKGILA
jgi:Ca2+-binding RTX toxin-like protein